MGQDRTFWGGGGYLVIMVKTYIRKSERRITNSEIVIQAVRKVIIDKCDESEVITELGILFIYYYF